MEDEHPKPNEGLQPAASEPKPTPVKSALGRLSRAACLRIDADTAEMMAAYTPIMERARDLKAQIVSFCGMVAEQYDVHARECLEVAASVEEFDLALWRDIPKMLSVKFGNGEWITEEMRRELSAGLAMFALDIPAWTKATPEERESAWHVGAILGESIRNLALQWRAEAMRRAAENCLEPEAPATAVEPVPQTGLEPPNVTEAGERVPAPRKRGPKPDYENAERVADTVARVAPDGDWRSKLDDVCEALHDEGIPFPKVWRSKDRNCRTWMDFPEREIAIKAIEYRLEVAKQRKKAPPETLS